MQLQILLFPILAVVLGVDASAKYKDCKCHDSNTKLQNDAVTKGACEKYQKEVAGGVSYSDTPHHQCATNNDLGGDVIDNGEWDKMCKSFGQQYYQYCWNKDCNIIC